jgi:GTPase
MNNQLVDSITENEHDINDVRFLMSKMKTRELVKLIESYNMPPEVEIGNIEYKYDLSNVDTEKKRKMPSQMLWRLAEGKKLVDRYECIYFIGVSDDGKLYNPKLDSIENSIMILEQIVDNTDAEISFSRIIKTKKGNVAFVKINKRAVGGFIKEIRIGLLGASNHGKTTCLSYLTYKQKDNGNGCGRLNIFNHNHEYSSGLTSSIKHEILGFKDKNLINYSSKAFSSWEHLILSSDYIIDFVDMPGCTKYSKTMLSGLLAHKPNYNIIVIGASDCYVGNSIVFDPSILHHIALSYYLNILFIVVVTKTDLVSDSQLSKLINYIDKQLLMIVPEMPTFIVSDADNITNDFTHYSIDKFLYIVPVSNVNEDNYQNLIKILSDLPIPNNGQNNDQIEPKIEPKIELETETEFMINNVFNIHELGTVVSGILLSGQINVGDNLQIGPIDDKFHPISVKSIHRKQMDCTFLQKDETGSIELHLKSDISPSKIDKHLTILNLQKNVLVRNNCVFCVINQVSNSRGHSHLKLGSQYMLYTKNLIEAVIINKINENNCYELNFVKSELKYFKENDYAVLFNTNLNDHTLIIGVVV